MFRRLFILALAVSPGFAFAASKEIQELQRDVAQLQDMVRTLQRAQDEKFAALQVLVQQSVNAANEASRAVAVIQNSFQQNLRDQQEKVVAPVVGLSTRMTQMSDDLRTVSQAVTDLTGLMAKLQAQLTDVQNAVKVMGTPPAPPPQSTGPGGTAAANMPAGAGGTPDVPTISASALYDNALRDMQGGKFDLALQEFSDYLKWYGNTELAPNAQFYVASVHYAKGDYRTAADEYDRVLEKYPDNSKTADALFGKGQSLFKLGRRTEGGKEFQELIKRYPRSDLAPKACEQLKSIGLSCGARAAAPRGSSKRKR
jgi:tol-pal system protein YbgF